MQRSGPSSGSAKHGSVASSASIEPYKHLESADAAAPQHNAAYAAHADWEDGSVHGAGAPLPQLTGTAVIEQGSLSTGDSGRAMRASTPARSDGASGAFTSTAQAPDSGGGYEPPQRAPATTGITNTVAPASLDVESGRMSRSIGAPASGALPGGTLNPATLPGPTAGSAPQSAGNGVPGALAPADHATLAEGTLNPRTVTLPPPPVRLGKQPSSGSNVQTPPLSVGSGYLTTLSRTVQRPSQLASMASSSARGGMYDSRQMADSPPPDSAAEQGGAAWEPDAADLSASRIKPSPTINDRALDAEVPPATRIVPPGQGNTTDVTIGGALAAASCNSLAGAAARRTWEAPSPCRHAVAISLS